MKLTKQRQSAALKVHDLYFESYIKGDIDRLSDLLVENYSQIGSAEEEVFFTKKDALKFVFATIDQVVGKLEMRNRKTTNELFDDYILIFELCDLYVLIENEWIFYSRFRATSVLQEKPEGWKIVHQHSSLPDAKAQEGDNIAIERISEENLQLRDAIKRRTIELENKNRELEIEAALERVRATAMSMQKSEDLRTVVEILYGQLRILGFQLGIASIVIMDNNTGDMDCWNEGFGDGYVLPERYHVPFFNHSGHLQQLEHWKSGVPYAEIEISGQEKKTYDAYYFFKTDFQRAPESSKQLMMQQESVRFSMAFMKYGALSWSPTPLAKEQAIILERFAKVFEQCYTRFLDLLIAEEQTKEAKIEAALERTRVKAMSIQKSDELNEIVKVVFDTLLELDFIIRDGAVIIMVFEKGSKDHTQWIADPDQVFPKPFKVEFSNHTLPTDIISGWENGSIGYQKIYPYKEKREYFEFLFEHNPAYNALPWEIKNLLLESREYGYSIAFGKHSALSVATNIGKLLTTNEFEILRRFSNVFDQAYTRYLDIQKAEAQAREAQIEAALERVRSASLAMHHSDELEKVVSTLSGRLEDLGIVFDGSLIFIFDREKRHITLWIATNQLPAPLKVNLPYEAEMMDHPTLRDLWNAIDKKESKFNRTYTGKVKDDYFRYVARHNKGTIPTAVQKLQLDLPSWSMSYVAEKNSVLAIDSWSGNNIGEEEFKILNRFAVVFEQAYVRFLDLQKAEAQAREAQIEAALEKIRSRSLAMHNSEELREVITVFFDKLIELGTLLGTVGIALFDQKSKAISYWVGNAIQDPQFVIAPFDEGIMKEENFISQSWKAMTNKAEMINVVYSKKQKDRYFDHLFGHNDLIQIPESARELMRKMDKHTVCFFPNRHSAVFVDSWDGKQYTEEDIAILRRAGKVFEQAYVRFLDLQKAEAQAREAQIEAALEKVRSRSLAMHKSDELKEVVKTVVEKMQDLDIEMNGGISLVTFEAGSHDFQHWLWIPGRLEDTFTAKVVGFDHPILADCREAQDQGLELLSKVYGKKDKQRYFKHIFEKTDFKFGPKETKDWVMQQPFFGFSFAIQKHSGIFLNDYSGKYFSKETNDILVRFSRVFEQAYVRFLDLQKAEAQAREAQIEAALERVRAKAMAMHKSEELRGVIQLVYEQLVQLNIRVHQAGFIMDYKKHDDWYLWMADYIQPIPTLVHFRYFDHPMFDLFNDAKAKALDFSTINLTQAEKNNLIAESYKYNPGVPNEIKEVIFSLPGYAMSASFYDNIVLFVANFEAIPLTDQENDVVRKFGKVFEQTYTRFLDLQKAEAQAREAQIEAALEKIRSRSLAMHSSAELNDVIATMIEKLEELKVIHGTLAIQLFDFETMDSIFCPGNNLQKEYPKVLLPFDQEMMEADTCHRDLWNAKKKGEAIFNKVYNKQQKDRWFDYVFAHNDSTVIEERAREYIRVGEVHTVCFFPENNAALFADSWDGSKYSEGEFLVLKRVAKVFDQAYTRFLDLQKAEAQARESQIEAALERVRSHSMAMQKSNDLNEVIEILYQEMKKLDGQLDRAFIITVDTQSLDTRWWMASGDEIQSQSGLLVKNNSHPFYLSLKLAWEQRASKWSFRIEGKEKREWDAFVFFETELSLLPEVAKANMIASPIAACFASFQNFGCLLAASYGMLSEDAFQLLTRFSKAFDQSYTRFLDLKNAEAQAREAQIEVALERVRAKAMAMHSSQELSEVVHELRKQMGLLGQKDLDTCVIHLYDESPDFIYAWAAIRPPKSEEDILEATGHIPKKGLLLIEEALQAYDTKQGDYVIINEGEKFRQWFGFIQKESPEAFSRIEESIRTTKQEEIRAFWSFADFEGGSLLMVTVERPDETSRNLLRRFANVFGLAYRRFADLKQAEAQAREAQIQLALERVRARTMAMQRSDELSEAAQVLYQQFGSLEIPTLVCGFIFIQEEKGIQRTWNVLPDGSIKKEFIDFPLTGDRVLDDRFKAWKEKVSLHKDVLAGKENKAHHRFLAAHVPAEIAKDIFANLPDTIHFYSANFNFGYLQILRGTPFNSEEEGIVIRFAKVFEQTYTRFLDLQKAEAQAREAKIETALEKVRSKSLAMHRSEELQEVVTSVFDRLIELDIQTDAINLDVFNENKKDAYLWTAVPGHSYSKAIHVPYTDSAIYKDIFDGMISRKSMHSKVYSRELKDEFLNYIFEHTDFREIPQERKDLLYSADASTVSVAYAKNTAIIAQRYRDNPFSDDENEILKRFAKVFDQAYTRFLDLQKAEAQAREAQIEGALEKIRSRSLAMHHSREIPEVIATMFEKLRELKAVHNTVAIQFFDFKTRDSVFWVGNNLQHVAPKILLPFDQKMMEADTCHRDLWNAMEKGEVIFNKVYTKQQKDSWFEYVFANNDSTVLEEQQREFIRKAEIHTVCFIPMKNAGLFASSWDGPKYSEENFMVLTRVAKVFDQAYTRFLDLQKAEEQAREAQIEAALERVRSRTMAMHKSEELQDAAHLLFKQVQTLGIPVFTCGYNIWEIGEKVCTGWMSSEGMLQPPFKIPLTESPTFIHFLESREKGVDFYVEEVGGEALSEHYKYMLTLPGFAAIAETFISAGFPFPTFQVNHVVNFKHGNLIFISSEAVPEEHDIFKRFGKVFEQTYTRFLDLQKAEAQAREAQIELGLERVRARAMAMQTSSELNPLIATVYSELTKLDISLDRCFIMIFDFEFKGVTWWIGSRESASIQKGFYVQSNDHPPHLAYFNAWMERQERWQYILEGQVKKNWDDFLFSETELSELPNFIIENMKAVNKAFLLASFNNFGCLTLASLEPLSDSHFNILVRFSKVFEMTYTRFNDLKQAEAQAREAQIEASLERVRSRTMAMHNSEDVTSATETMFEELIKLGIENLRCGIANIHLDRTFDVFGVTNLADGNKMSGFGFFGIDEHPIWQRWFESWKNKEEVFIAYIAGQEKEEYFNNINNHSKYLPQKLAGFPDSFFQAYFFEQGAVWVYSLFQHSEQEKEIMKRFATGFSLTFRRYQDLKKAEAQARESQIEAALERVRSQTMAMHKSEDLLKVITVVSEQLQHLNFKFNTVCFASNSQNQGYTFWFAILGDPTPIYIKVPYIESPMFDRMNEVLAQGIEFYSDTLTPEENRKWHEHVFNNAVLPSLTEETKAYILRSGYARSIAIKPSIMLIVSNYAGTPYSDSENEIIKRFGTVFEQSYTRFLDLKKAEGQAREAQIEAALERVRARTMAMHNSSELIETAELLFDQLKHLGAESQGVAFAICDKESIMVQKWTSIGVFSVPYTLEAGEQRMYEAWKNQSEIYEEVYEGERLRKYYELFMEIPEFKQGIQKFIESGNPIPEWQKNHAVPFKYGYLLVITTKPFEETPIFTRFAKVFEQTYTRFLDLKKAEARARESQVENALEKVRSRTMAMQHSDELAEAAFVLFQQLQTLGVVHERINIGIVKEESKTIDFWITEQGGNQINTRFTGRIDEPSTLSKMYLGWKMNQKSMIIDQTGEDLANWLKYLKEEIRIPFDPAFSHNRRVQTVGFFSKGMLVLTTPEPLPEENLGLLEKFAGVFDLTYTRFSDLKHAEAQAREAKIEVALERIRARALAMQSSTELSDVANVLREQMGILGQEDLEASVVHLYSAGSPTFDSWYAFRAGDKIIEGQTTFRLENSVLAKEFLKLYLDEITEYTIEVKGEKLKDWLAEIKRNAPQIAVYWGDLPPEKQFYHFSDFSGGALLMVSHQNLSEETRMLQKRCAWVFELAYKRFLDLKSKERQDKELREEKQRLEKALSELKATQSQLIQSEKMASLGQLTAGIAHEIKNPLNFVNNFSEVSVELIDEVFDELEKLGNSDSKDEIIAILMDVKNNIAKVNEHGKRADGIVKSMLQHSRASGNNIESSPFNPIVREYTNLAYHGMRAGKSPINVEIDFQLDPEVGEVKMISEDFSRVILNLCNNAFDAMREKLQEATESQVSYDPKLTISTKKASNEEIQLTIKDNGKGIPEDIIDKILEPFFTTKKGTEGTGLGLSISYDIIKAHGGELEVRSTVGIGTEFIIQLPIGN